EITELAKNEEIKTSVIIESYETYGNYEIVVSANVENPRLSESNKIFVNSIELGSEGPTVVNTKIKYTRDLLSENSACLELNEFLAEAQKAIESSDYAQASKILDSTIRTCKYLITEKKRLYEKPTRFSVSFGRNAIIIAGIVGAALVMSIIIYFYTRKRFY
ncbi:MAG: hypothetical protein NTV63_04985, partial [Candidatus Woesearchaeota archaeon]|nr:hypothetical protein [Candidatus Woesearchaeota archaeon]